MDVPKWPFLLADDIPGDIQQLCEALWTVSASNQTLTAKSLDQAIKKILSREEGGYNNIYANFTANQKRVFYTVALSGGEHTTSSKFVRNANLSNPSIVKRAIDSLTEQRVLYVENREYKFASPFFRIWVLKKHALEF